jgi:outer membrane receptor protein involved in Fe transport
VPSLLVLSLSIGAGGSAWAGAGRNPFREADESEFFRLDDKLVTVASRYAQSLRKAPNLVTIIQADTLRERGYRTLSNALRDLPGVYIWSSPEGRHLAAFRGIVSSDNNKILLLIDGVPLYDGVYTHAWIDDYLPLHHIEQIEVIKGPGSAVYGTNAFAGVVNVVTMKAEDLRGARVRVLGGSGTRLDASVTAGGVQRLGALDLATSAYVRVLTQDGEGQDFTPQGRSDIRGEDPKRGLAIGGTIDLAGVTARLHHIDYRHSYLTQEQDDLFDMLGGDIDDFGLMYHATLLDLRYAWSAVPQLTLTPRVWAQHHDNPGSYAFWDVVTDDEGAVDQLDVSVVETEKVTTQWGVGLDAELRPHPNHVTVAGLGLDTTRVVGLVDTVFSGFDDQGVPTEFTAPTGARLRNAHAYAAHTWSIATPIEVTVGGRLDKRFVSNDDDNAGDDAFRLFGSPRVALLLAPLPRLHAKVLYGRAFRHANVRETLVTNELDEDGEYPFANGSLDLRPEQVDTVDLEVYAEPSERVTVRATGSWSTLSHEIDKVTPPNAYRNLDGSLNVATAEAEVTADVDIVEVRGAYAFTWAEYADKGPYAGRTQYEFPPHMLKGNLALRPIEQWSLTLTAEVYSPRPRRSWAPNSGLSDGDAFGLLHLGMRAWGSGPTSASSSPRRCAT